MSVITVQLGQCGNQVGGELFNTLIQDAMQGKDTASKPEPDYSYFALDNFFEEDAKKSGQWLARAVMVDMESKAIAMSLYDASRSGVWKYREGQQLSENAGSGNNWAHGYCTHAPKVANQVLKMVRKEVERCDRLGGFLPILSLAGGTGSGLGTYVTEQLRENYPEAFITCQVVWPYSTGEVIVQNYNALLTLAHLYNCADAVISTENDALHEICAQRLAIKKVGFKDLNCVLAHQLASILSPASADQSNKLIHHQLGAMLQHLIAMPSYRLLSVRCLPWLSAQALPYSTFQWSGMLRHLKQMLLSWKVIDEGLDWQMDTSQYPKCASNLVILRGMDCHEADASMFQSKKFYPEWLFSLKNPYATWRLPRLFLGYEKSMTLVSNSQEVVRPLDRIVGKAWKMFGERAYLHQYFRHGLTDEAFMDSFAMLEQVIQSYKTL